MEAHRGAMGAWARRLAGAAQDWEGLVQEASLRAWEHRASLPTEPAPLRAWLYRTLRGLAVDGWRHRSRRLEGQADRVPLDADLHGGEASPQDGLEQRELSRALLGKIDAFGDPTRSVLLAYYVLDLERKEIAAALGLGYEQVKSVIRYRTPQLQAWLVAQP